MDDKTFDLEVALDWIRTIEGSPAVRDKDIYPMLNTWLEEIAAQEILDLGCGQGVCCEKIDLAGRRYTGLEPSPFLLARARELYSADGRRFEQGNVYQMPFPSEAFDAVFSIAVWHLLSDLPKATCELSRVLKSGGHFLIIAANPDARAAWLQCGASAQSSDVLYFHSIEDQVVSLTRAHLSVDKVWTFRPGEKADLFVAIQGRKRD